MRFPEARTAGPARAIVALIVRSHCLDPYRSIVTMSFNNTQYLYDHLPARFRRDDQDLLLRRYLQIFGDTLDAWDGKFDSFYTSIAPATATLEWITFWLQVLFGWSWFPWWFTLADKRRVYGNFAKHLARRGTRRGIELFLKDFGILARVHTRAQAWGEGVYGEQVFSITQPLYLIIEILQVDTPMMDASYLEEGCWGEAIYTVPKAPITEKEILELVRYQQPHAQQINVVWRLGGYEPVNYDPVWGQISW